jgi:hypothetical protein
MPLDPKSFILAFTGTQLVHRWVAVIYRTFVYQHLSLELLIQHFYNESSGSSL